MRLFIILLSTSFYVESQLKLEVSSENLIKPKDTGDHSKIRSSTEALVEKLDKVRRRRRKIMISTEAPSSNSEPRFKVKYGCMRKADIRILIFNS